MREEVDLLLSGGTIVTVDKGRRLISDGAVAILGDKIVEVGKLASVSSKYKANRTIDTRGKIVLPGLIDTHNHVAQSLVKALVYEDLGWSMIFRIHVASEGMLDADALRASTLLCCAQLIKSGVTTFAETTATPGHRDTILKTVLGTQMRCAWAWTSAYDINRWKDIRTIGVDRQLADTKKVMRDNEQFLKTVQTAGKGRIRPWISAGSIALCSDEFFTKTKEMADKYHSGFMTHINRDRDEIELMVSATGKRPIEHLADIGVLDKNFLAIHAMHTTDREIGLMAKHGSNVAHCPLVCFDITSAITKVPAMISAQVNVGLGCDNVLNDLFEVMRTAFIMHQSVYGVPHFDPLVLTCEQIIEMATINGAKALLWDKEIGSLEAGKKADVTIIDPNMLYWIPTYNVVGELVRIGTSREVDTVIINGKIVMEHRQLKTIDESVLTRQITQISKHIRSLEKSRYYPMLQKFKYQ